MYFFKYRTSVPPGYSWICERADPHLPKMRDPDPHWNQWNQCGSATKGRYLSHGYHIVLYWNRTWYRTITVTIPYRYCTGTIRVSDPHWFNADPDTDPDPSFFLIADPDPGSGYRIRIPDPDPRFDDPKLKKTYKWKFNFYFLDQKLQFTYP